VAEENDIDYKLAEDKKLLLGIFVMAFHKPELRDERHSHAAVEFDDMGNSQHALGKVRLH
jgi:hypothetical protein